MTAVQQVFAVFRRHRRWLAVPLLLVFFGLTLAQITTTSPTFDEGFTLLRGYAALRTGHLVPIGHPPLAHWLSAAGVVLEPNLPDPRSLDGWYSDSYDDSSRDLLWRRGLNAGRISFLGRFPILLLGLILGAVTARWAKELFGWGAGLAALALHAFSPNLLANSAVATTDLPVAAFYVFTLYAWCRFTQRPTAQPAIITGLMLGCALTSKFSALLLFPTLGLFALIYLIQNKTNWQRIIGNGLLILVVAALAIWANYGFSFSPYPFAQYSRELTDLGRLASEGHTAYLLGNLSLTGWRYYHLVVFLVKTPLPVLVLLAVAAWQLIRNVLTTPRASLIATFINSPASMPITAAAIYLLAASLTSLNVGYRYLLPALPLLHLLASSVFARRSSQQPPTNYHLPQLVTAGLFAFQVASTALIAPHFLAFFNEIVGSANGYKILADSNLDWGQDLPALADYLNGRPVHLSYFGMADPAYYGINATPLPAWPPPPLPSPFAPADPAPGLYAISASNLVGVQLYEPNSFNYFRNRTPIDVINYSIFIYEVPEHAPVAALAQCLPAPLNDSAADALFDNRVFRPLVFDCQTSLVIPAQPALLLYPENVTPLAGFTLEPVLDWKRTSTSPAVHIYHPPSLTQNNPPTFSEPTRYLTLLNYELTTQALTLTWRVDELAPPPVSIFVHFNWPDGALAEAYDGLGLAAEYWQVGDIIIQRHAISPDLPPGEYPIIVGLYSLADQTRYSEIPLATYSK
jgi:4-amino-4-deoxy-L-arabinose transferase-like glycosyltransferase